MDPQIVGLDGRVCLVLILWAVAYGVHVVHPDADGCDLWITGTLRPRHKEAVWKENGQCLLSLTIHDWWHDDIRCCLRQRLMDDMFRWWQERGA